ncbi:TraB/GumN family protein [Donghicola sp. C2-DW-16]|uniref:TraB/GumN family protein n=1 Tax=Donghicola mangrovi TaxID=2729614 RepID=A0ABX2PFI8_9RHOB|nr:TraB/GumN family protein [Donghicola mangrovi]NVO28240.1 TraB/GumN family protein [Donghicola mangrovi]
MPRLIALVFLSLFQTLPAFAACGTGPDLGHLLTPAEQAEVAAEEAATPNGTGTLWKATKDEQTVFLVGTMHLPDPRHSKTMEALRPILKGISALYLETASDGEALMEAEIAKNPALMFTVSGPTLPDLLDDATWAVLRDGMATRGVPAPLTAKMRPWYVSMLMSMPPCAIESINSGVGGLDMMAERAAKALDIPVRSLEDWQTLFTAFDQIPYQEQVDLMALSLMPDDLSEAAFTATLDAYFDQNHARAWALSDVLGKRIPGMSPDRIEAESARMKDLFLDSRNTAWVPVILDGAQDGPILIAVGAAHLIGEKGLVALLENEGFSLTRLPL